MVAGTAKSAVGGHLQGLIPQAGGLNSTCFLVWQDVDNSLRLVVEVEHNHVIIPIQVTLRNNELFPHSVLNPG